MASQAGVEVEVLGNGQGTRTSLARRLADRSVTDILHQVSTVSGTIV